MRRKSRFLTFSMRKASSLPRTWSEAGKINVDRAIVVGKRGYSSSIPCSRLGASQAGHSDPLVERWTIEGVGKLVFANELSWLPVPAEPALRCFDVCSLLTNNGSDSVDPERATMLAGERCHSRPSAQSVPDTEGTVVVGKVPCLRLAHHPPPVDGAGSEMRRAAGRLDKRCQGMLIPIQPALLIADRETRWRCEDGSWMRIATTARR